MDEICHSTEPVALAISYGFIIFLSIFAGALSFLIFIFYKLFYPQQETNSKNNLPIADSAEPLTGNVQGHDLNVQKTMKWSSSTSSSTQFRESQIHYRSNKGQKIKFETHMPAFTGHNFIYINIKHKQKYREITSSLISSNSSLRSRIGQFKFCYDELIYLNGLVKKEEQIVGKSVFKGGPLESFNISTKQRNSIIDRLLDRWYSRMNHFISRYFNCSLDNLKAIVLGGISLKGYNPYQAFLSDSEEPSPRPPIAIRKFLQLLSDIGKDGKAILLPLNYPATYTANWCQEKGVLFINSCLSSEFYDVINAQCTVEFINRLLERNKQPKVLDLRLARFVNRSQLCEALEQDREQHIFSPMDEWTFKLNATGERLFRIGDPAYWDAQEKKEWTFIKEKVKRWSDGLATS